MSQPTFLRNLKRFGSEEPTTKDIRALEAELYSGPDRTAGVVLASLVERSLGRLLRSSMRSDGVEDLFEPEGLMGTFSAKIKIAYALNLIGPTTRHDLNIIRSLRNQFAHSRRPIRFTTPVVRIACQHLSIPDLPGVTLSFRMLEKTPRNKLRAAADKSHPRTRFFTSCNEIAQRIYLVRTDDKNDALNQLP